MNDKINELKLSVPYNQDPSLIDRLSKYRSYIYEIYMPCPIEIMGSGRNWASLSYKNNSAIMKIIKKIKDVLRIKVNILFNATVLNPLLERKKILFKIIAFLEKVIPEGVEIVTLTDLMLAKEIRWFFPRLSIEASVQAQINSVTKAQTWLETAKINRICIDKDINKNLKLLKQIRKIKDLELKMIVNELCLGDCPWRNAHANMLALVHLGKEKTDYAYCSECTRLRRKKPWLIYQSPYIVPYNLRYYEDLIDVIKISGRSYPTEIILEFVEHYINNSDSISYGTDLIYKKALSSIWGKKCNAIEPKKVFKKIIDCDKNCFNCDWCRKIYFIEKNREKNL